MKAAMWILIALIVLIGGYKLFEHWEAVKERRVLEEKAARGADIDSDKLPGMPWQLVQKLRDAQQAGPACCASRSFCTSCHGIPGSLSESMSAPRAAFSSSTRRSFTASQCSNNL